MPRPQKKPTPYKLLDSACKARLREKAKTKRRSECRREAREARELRSRKQLFQHAPQALQPLPRVPSESEDMVAAPEEDEQDQPGCPVTVPIPPLLANDLASDEVSVDTSTGDYSVNNPCM